MRDPIRVGASYFALAFDQEDDSLVEDARETLKGVDYDTMIGTGLSGSLVIPVLARALGKKFAIVRKEHSPHDNSLVVGKLGHRWIFVDDFVSGGTTRRNVIRAVEKVAEDFNHEMVYVGTYEYQTGWRQNKWTEAPNYDTRW